MVNVVLPAAFVCAKKHRRHRESPLLCRLRRQGSLDFCLKYFSCSSAVASVTSRYCHLPRWRRRNTKPSISVRDTQERRGNSTVTNSQSVSRGTCSPRGNDKLLFLTGYIEPSIASYAVSKPFFSHVVLNEAPTARCDIRAGNGSPQTIRALDSNRRKP